MKKDSSCKWCERDHSDDPLLTTRDVARRLGRKDIKTVRTYIKKGFLAGDPGVGGQYQIHAAELCRFIHEHTGGIGPHTTPPDLPDPDEMDDLIDGLGGRS